jgi:hypothetical protein
MSISRLVRSASRPNEATYQGIPAATISPSSLGVMRARKSPIPAARRR